MLVDQGLESSREPRLAVLNQPSDSALVALMESVIQTAVEDLSKALHRLLSDRRDLVFSQPEAEFVCDLPLLKNQGTGLCRFETHASPRHDALRPCEIVHEGPNGRLPYSRLAEGTSAFWCRCLDQHVHC